MADKLAQQDVALDEHIKSEYKYGFTTILSLTMPQKD